MKQWSGLFQDFGEVKQPHVGYDTRWWLHFLVEVTLMGNVPMINQL